MALFSHIGKHCAAAGCNRQDFLPFSCDSCGQNFCLEHRTYESHACEAGCKKQLGRVTMSCPLCNESVTAKPNQSNDEAMALHVQNGCVKGDMGKQVRQDRKAKRKKNRCQHKGCKTKLHGYDSFSCSSCGRHFCVSHRMKDDHKCKKYTRRLHMHAHMHACGIDSRVAHATSADTRCAIIVSWIAYRNLCCKAFGSNHFVKTETCSVADNAQAAWTTYLFWPRFLTLCNKSAYYAPGKHAEAPSTFIFPYLFWKH